MIKDILDIIHAMNTQAKVDFYRFSLTSSTNNKRMCFDEITKEWYVLGFSRKRHRELFRSESIVDAYNFLVKGEKDLTFALHFKLETEE